MDFAPTEAAKQVGTIGEVESHRKQLYCGCLWTVPIDSVAVRASRKKQPSLVPSNSGWCSTQAVITSCKGWS